MLESRAMRRLLFLGIIALSGCRPAPRTIHLKIAADATFRQRANWQEVIRARVHEASALFEKQFNIHWVAESITEWSPDPQASLERRRWQLGGYLADGNSVFLGIEAAPAGESAPASVVPFDPRLIVFDYPSKGEAENTLLLAHAMGQLLGAWESGDAGSVMHLPPGSGFDGVAARAIAATRAVDFSKGVRSLNADTVARIGKLWAESKSGGNPVYEYYLNRGTEALKAGKATLATEPLTHAVEVLPTDTRAHNVLGTAYMVMRQYPQAAHEFQKVVELDPQNYIAWNNLGGALLQFGEPAEAIEPLRKALKMRPGDGAIHGNYGAALARTPGHLAEGIAELQECLRINPQATAAQQALAVALAKKNGGAQ